MILELGAWIPDTVIYSETLQADIDCFPELKQFRIQEKSGVCERRIAPDHVSVLDMAENATRDCISRLNARSDFNVSEIDTIIYCAVSRMYSEPSTASLLQRRLDIHSAMSFDVSDACLSFLNGLILADSLIQSGRSRMVLIVSAEKGAKIMKISRDAMLRGERGPECLASLTLGDGATAALVCSNRYSDKVMFSLTAFSRTTLGEFSDCCILPTTESPMITDSNRIFNGALTHYPKMLKDLLRDIDWEINDIKFFIYHQASLKIIHRAAELINCPLKKCSITLDRYGNMASVSVPFTLKTVIDSGAINYGDKIVLLGFGSGLSFSMMALEAVNTGALWAGNSETNSKVPVMCTN